MIFVGAFLLSILFVALELLLVSVIVSDFKIDFKSSLIISLGINILSIFLPGYMVTIAFGVFMYYYTQQQALTTVSVILGYMLINFIF